MSWNQAVLALFAAGGFGQTVVLTDHGEHKPLEWKGGGCVVNFGKTPCRTVRYREYSFGSSLGFDSITRTESIEAFDHDGSEVKIVAAARRRFWLLPELRVRTAEILLRQQNRTLHVVHDRKVFAAENRGAYNGYPLWEEDDSQCSHAKSHYMYLSQRLRDSVVAGVHVVGYGGRDDRGAEYEVYFAPSIGCQQFRFMTWMPGFWGWTTARYELVVESYEAGPPSSSLFTIPGGYREISFEELTKVFRALQ
jgi:hypothetical protein